MDNLDMMKIEWIIAIHHPMWTDSETFTGTPEECAHQVIKRAIETERWVTASSKHIDTVYDSRVLDFWF